MKWSGRMIQIRGDPNSQAFHTPLILLQTCFYPQSSLPIFFFLGSSFLHYLTSHLQMLGIHFHYPEKLRERLRKGWGVQKGVQGLQHTHLTEKVSFWWLWAAQHCLWKCRGNNSAGFKALGLITLNNSGFRIYVHHISKLKMILLLKKLTVFLMSSLYISVGNIHSLLISASGWWYFTSTLFKKEMLMLEQTIKKGKQRIA